MLTITNLTKSYDSRPALRGISLQLKKGEVYGLLGPNGAGKTTTLKILSGLLTHDSGEIHIGEKKYDRDNSQLKQLIAYVPDQPFVYAKLTGEEHLNFYADLYKVPASPSVRKEKFDFYFDYFEFDMFRHQLVETYSAGTRQKLLLSQALMVEPQILLLDEPMTSIDPLVARKFKQLLKKVSANGTVVIFATHILSLAQEVSHRIGIIVNGNIISEGSLEELLNLSEGAAGNLEDFYFNTVMNYE
ncbi:MAG: ABC transporter ATP-binding protein [bacterium]|nr:ABC transporter ATP-binding protein [bacterium]